MLLRSSSSPFLEASETIQNRTLDRKGGDVVCASIGTLVRTPFRFGDSGRQPVEARVGNSRACDCRDIVAKKRGKDTNCKQMLHTYDWICDKRVRTYF